MNSSALGNQPCRTGRWARMWSLPIWLLTAIGMAFSGPALAVTFTTIADGDWSNPATWSGGAVPHTGGDFPPGDTINVCHDVVWDNSDNIVNEGTVIITPCGGSTSASLLVPDGVNIENKGGTWNIIDAALTQHRFFGGGDTGTSQGGTFKNIGGTVFVSGSVVEIAQDWTNESGATRTFVDSCLLTGQDFSNSDSVDILENANISIGWHGSGNFQYADTDFTFNEVFIQLAGTSGSVDLVKGNIDGHINYITLWNHVTNSLGGGEIFFKTDLNPDPTITLDAYCAANFTDEGILANTPTAESTASCPSTDTFFPCQVLAPATVTLIKNVINDNGGNAGVNDFGLTIGGAAVNSGVATPVDANTPVALNEAGLAGYNFVSITGTGCPASLGGTVTLNEGESITCTITNNDVAPTVTLIKNVINDNGGNAGVNDFGLTIGGAAVNSGVATPVDANTPVALNEAGLAGYSFVSITGTGCPASLGGTVTLNEGESVTCTIANNDDAAGLTVVKTIQSNSGGTATLDDFNVSVDAVEVAWSDPTSTTGGSEFITDQAGTYTLSEDSVNGYTPGTWSCSDGAPVAVTNAGLFSGADVTIALGQSVTCSITNQDDETSLVITKVIESNNGGTATLGDFDVSVDAVEVSWTNPAATDTGTETVANEAGTYTLSEIDFAGYTEGTWSCNDSEGAVAVTNSGAFDGADVTVALGQTVTCSITNTDDPITLNLVKQVTNNNGGSAVAGDWNVAADGPDANDFNGAGSASSSTLVIGSYDLSESGGPSGYTPSAWVCTGDGTQDDDDTITLGLGDTATCTITNDDVAPVLTVIKTVVNDNGGTATAGQWTMDVTADNPSSNNFAGTESPGVDITIDAGAYSVDESGGPSGYAKTLGAGCSGTLGVGETASCTITNDDIQPLLTVTKIVINDDGGQALVSDFPLFVDATQVTSGVQNGFDAGSYTVSEVQNEDYAATIGGDCAGSGAITLAPGDVKTCTITNNDIGPAVTVPANNIWALLLMILTVLGSGLYFRQAITRN